MTGLNVVTPRACVSVMLTFTRMRNVLGDAIGRVWAPAVAAISHARHARMFHPVGHTFVGRCEPATGRYRALGEALGSHVLARFSGALSKHEREYLDVLGCALRFRDRAITDATVQPGDQDLLLATIRSPFTMLASPLFTNARDFVTNAYWAVSPFEHPVGRIELRLVPETTHIPEDVTRSARLSRAVRDGQAAWRIEARETLHLGWQGVARIVLEEPIALDQTALRFDPYHDGAGLHPVGVVHAIRRAVYPASQRGRNTLTDLVSSRA